ncbi:MAG: glycosyl transferase, partial [Microbacterium sp.]
MTATLRIVLDHGTSAADSDLATAALELARGLVATAPTDCVVEAIVPSGDDDPVQAVPGLASVERLALPRRELLAAWQLGVPTGVGGGLIHAPSLAAPLTRHD